MRARLHLSSAGRREDRLVFDLQNTMAQAFGLNTLTPGEAAPTARGMRRASEALMKQLLLGGQGRDAAQPNRAAQH